MEWEYRLYSVDPERSEDNIEEALNDFGRDGWELVTSYLSSLRLRFVFKRTRRSK